MAALENLVLFETSTASARGRQALQFGFEREGIEFAACEQPNALVALCIKQAPQLVVISLPDGEKPIAETLAALDELRATESIARTPVLVLGERDLRDEVLRAGADEFMPRPAYLRDVITLAKMVVGLRAREDRELRGLVEEYGLFFLLRALSVVGRSAIIELERVGRYAELHIVAGEVAMARIGRMAGQHAFQHLLLWHDARLRLRLESPSAERKIFVPTLRLLEDASRFAQKFEETASKVGGSRVIFRRVVSRAAEVRATIPAEIETFSHLCDGRRTLVDIVEESTFRPLDVIKIVHRLEKLGAIERVAVARQPAGEASVYNWLRGNEHPDYPQDHRSTVTEAGRRAAEAHAEEHARRGEDRAPSDDVLPQSSLLQRLGEAGAQQAERRANPQPQSNKHGKKNKHKHQQQQPTPSSARTTTPATPAAKAAAATPSPASNGSGNGKPSEPAREVEDQETRPFFKPATDEPAAAKLSPAAHKALPTKEPVFDEVEDAFFAQEAELSKVDPVESFDDLDAGLPKKPAARWSFMSLFRPTPTVKRPATASPPANGSSSSSSSSSSGANKAPSSKTGKKR